jgi:translation initiation factor IF-1
MAKDDLAQLEGKIVDVNAGGLYRVMLDNECRNRCAICGKMRRFNIRVVVGDKVTVGVSPYDPTNGLILYRHISDSLFPTMSLTPILFAVYREKFLPKISAESCASCSRACS